MSFPAGWSEWVPFGVLLALTAWLAGGAVISAAQPERAAESSTSLPGAALSSALLLPVPLPTFAAPAETRQPDAAPTSIAPTPTAAVVSAEWASAAAAATGIPLRALVGYAGAELRLATEQPACGIGWTTLAALGSIESDHGRNNGSTIDARGVTVPGVFGPLLDGRTYDAFPDTDAGAQDDNTVWDRAVGPLQFIPATWALWGADANADSVADPQQIDDAALAAGRYLCHTGDLSRASSWRSAIYSYNHVTSYVDLVAARANSYAARMP